MSAIADNTARHSAILRAGLWMVGTLLSFAVMAVCGRELAGELTTFQILFWRSLVGFLMIATLLTYFGWGQLRTASFHVHGIRAIVHFGGQFGWFYAIGLIPLVEVFALEFTMPIWVVILASMILRERLTMARLISVGLGFVGVVVILQPGAGSISIGSLAALGAAFGYAATQVATRFLAQRDTPLCILFYMTIIQLPLGLAASLSDWQWPALADWPWLLLVGITAMTAHYTLARAMRLAEAGVVAPMGFLRLPMIAVIGYLFYGEALQVWVGLGAVLICAGIVLNVRDAKRR